MAFFQVNSKLLRWFLCLKRVTFKYLEIIARFLYCHQSRKCSRKRHTAISMNISHLMRFSMTVSTDFENITQPNEFMNWGSHSVKIVNKICRTMGVMNCLKRYLPLSALKIMYDSLILSHIQFSITRWGFEWGRLAKLQKNAVRIITNSKYNAHTEPLFKDLHFLKITDIFDVQCIKFWYKFSNNTLPNYFRSMFQYNSSLYETETRNHDRMHVFQPERLLHVTSCDIAS